MSLEKGREKEVPRLSGEWLAAGKLDILSSFPADRTLVAEYVNSDIISYFSLLSNLTKELPLQIAGERNKKKIAR